MTVLSASVSYEVESRWSTNNTGRFYTNIDKKINELVMGGDIPWSYGATHLSFNFSVVFPDLYEPTPYYTQCPNSGPYIHWGAFDDERERGNSASLSGRWAADVGWLTGGLKNNGYYQERLYDVEYGCSRGPVYSFGEKVFGVATLSITYSPDGDEDAIRECAPSARSARVSLLYRKGDSQIRAMTKNVGFSKNQDTSVVFDIRNDFEHEPYKGLDIVGVKVSPNTSALPAGYGWHINVGRTRPMLFYAYLDVFNTLFFGDEYLLEYDVYPSGLHKGVQYTPLGFNSDGYGNYSNPSLVYTVEVVFNKINPADDECFTPDDDETPLTMGGDDFIAWVTDDEISEEEKEERIGIFFPPESDPVLPPDFVLVEPDVGGGMTIIEPKPPTVDEIEPVLPPDFEPDNEKECCENVISVINRLVASVDSLNFVVSAGFNGLTLSLQAMHVDLVNSLGVEQKRDAYNTALIELLEYISTLLKSGDMSITDVLKTLDTFLMIDTNNKSIDVEVSNLKNINLEV